MSDSESDDMCENPDRISDGVMLVPKLMEGYYDRVCGGMIRPHPVTGSYQVGIQLRWPVFEQSRAVSLDTRLVDGANLAIGTIESPKASSRENHDQGGEE